MSWWKAIADLWRSISLNPHPSPLDPVEQSCIDNLKRTIAEKDAQIRSMTTSLGNRTKTINRLKAELARVRGT